MAQRIMPISTRWFQGAVVTYLIGFTVLGILAYLVYRDQPPLPAQIVAGDRTIFTVTQSGVSFSRSGRVGIVGKKQAGQFRVRGDSTRFGKTHGAPAKPTDRQRSAQYE